MITYDSRIIGIEELVFFKAGFLVLKLKLQQFHSRLIDFSLTPSLTEMILTHENQLPWTNEDKGSCQIKEIIPSRVLCFENAVLKKVKANFRVGFAPFFTTYIQSCWVFLVFGLNSSIKTSNRFNDSLKLLFHLCPINRS